MRPWHLGNTTVRSPFRLRDGLKVLASSKLIGHIKGRENESSFARLLHQNGIVAITRESPDVSDFGRKWRAALSQLGFIVPEVDKELIKNIGPAFTITKNGQRLIEVETVPGMQECFLRSLSAYYIPSLLEKEYKFKVFSPLRHTLLVMLDIERRTGESKLNLLEMGLILQLSTAENPISEIVDQIIEFRNMREATTNKRRFDQKALEQAGEKHGYVISTFRDYADTNFRYLKATGLVQHQGHGLILVPEKHVFIEKLVQETRIPDNKQTYLTTLCNGASLPTDDKEAALAVLGDLTSQLNQRDIPFNISGRKLETPADIAIIRHEIEQLISERKEEEYAARQAHEWEEISTYMDILIHRSRSRFLSNGEEIKIPQTEAAAYFEWILWRAFLAIDSLKNKPYDARRFKIDQDFLPVSTAPGNGPDLIFEFDNFVVVVEVTLTDNSRQEAVEGEPVRRHVAQLVDHYTNKFSKRVYGLFIAKKIDVNTAETFRSGVWYTAENQKMVLNIVPVTLMQFKTIFEAVFNAGKIDVNTIFEFLEKCGSFRAHDAPIWKDKIEYSINETVANFKTKEV